MADESGFGWGASVGQCIYCGATKDLRDEHVVPYGLNGRWILRNATCKLCADITSRFEFEVLRKALLAPRAVLGFNTRRKKQRPQSLPLQIDRGSGPEEIELPLDKHPGIAILPRFESPSWFHGREQRSGITVVGANAAHFGAVSAMSFAQENRGSKLQLTVQYEPMAFARLVAKVALGYCVAQFGIALTKESYLLAGILGTSDDLGTWVGSTSGYELELSPAPEGRVTHVVGTDVVNGDIVAYVRLFAWAVPDEYIAVVAPAPDGHRDPSAQNRKLSDLAI
jgi:hypothetical protein